MRGWVLLGLGLPAYAIALAATAPATLADAGLRQASEGRLRLAMAKGTLWSGSGTIEIRAPDGRTGVAGDFAWHLMPGSLLRGHLVCEVILGSSDRRIPVTLSWSGITLTDARFHLPASVLGFGSPRLALLGLTGDVEIHMERLSFAKDAVAGNATLLWRAAGSDLASLSPLGDYELRLDGKGRTVQAVLRTLEGPLQLDGKGTWTRDTAPAFQATAHVLPQHHDQLAPLLRMIAIERGSGRFDLGSKSTAPGS